jgi:serine phosphatase RsbU (regulator of sigma subunit)/Tfp pilus assembly protein PilF
MINRFTPALLIVFLISIGSCPLINGQSSDSILYLLREGKAKDNLEKYGLLCTLASISTESDTIIRYSEEAIKLADKIGLYPAQAFVLKGNGYLYSGRLASAVECYLKAAKYYEEDQNNLGLAAAYASISEAYNQQRNFDNAGKYLKRAIEIFRKEKDTIRLASALHNLGYTNFCMEKYDTALLLYSEIGAIYQKLGKQAEYAYCLGNSGVVFSRQSKFDLAEDYLLRAIEILTNQAENGDERAVIEYMIEYAGILQNKGEINKGIATAKMSFNKAATNHFLEFERDAAYRLSKLYQVSEKYDSAYHYLSFYVVANDSIKEFKSIQKIAALQTKYEVSKKDAEVIALEKNKLIQLIVIIGLLVILFMAIGLILMYYYSLKRSQKLTTALKERGVLLAKQGKELKDQREELLQQKEEIISSINYAKYIQSSLLPQEEQLQSLLGEHFVLYKPKDIVSGDFYWISNIENKTVVAAVDCTGHGVPGAFMSMLGTALLNEIVNKEYITHPGVILRHLRKEVINSLQQKGERGEQKDGMDIALCALDLENMKLQFAGANNPLYLVRKSGLEKAGTLRCELDGDEHLYEIKGDLMPIGISDKMSNFTFHEIDIFKGDTIYLFSDGFPDQFGGRDNKKFGYKRFRELLLRNNTRPLADNKAVLEEALHEWMGDNGQIDDILVIGFRIG